MEFPNEIRNHNHWSLFKKFVWSRNEFFIDSIFVSFRVLKDVFEIQSVIRDLQNPQIYQILFRVILKKFSWLYLDICCLVVQAEDKVGEAWAKYLSDKWIVKR